jgi:hypothetical protein
VSAGERMRFGADAAREDARREGDAMRLGSHRVREHIRGRNQDARTKEERPGLEEEGLGLGAVGPLVRDLCTLRQRPVSPLALFHRVQTRRLLRIDNRANLCVHLPRLAEARGDAAALRGVGKGARLKYLRIARHCQLRLALVELRAHQRQQRLCPEKQRVRLTEVLTCSVEVSGGAGDEGLTKEMRVCLLALRERSKDLSRRPWIHELICSIVNHLIDCACVTL